MVDGDGTRQLLSGARPWSAFSRPKIRALPNTFYAYPNTPAPRGHFQAYKYQLTEVEKYIILRSEPGGGSVLILTEGIY